jgi:hypothetical protein
MWEWIATQIRGNTRDTIHPTASVGIIIAHALIDGADGKIVRLHDCLDNADGYRCSIEHEA